MTLGRDLIDAYVEELANVVGALLEQPATIAPGQPPDGAHWLARLQAEGADGTRQVAIDVASATALAAAVAGCDPADASEAVIADTLQEIHSQVAGALSARPLTRGARLRLASVERVDQVRPAGDWAAHAIAVAPVTPPLTVTSWGSFTLIDQSASPAPSAVGAAPATPAGEGGASGVGSATAAAVPALDRIDVILDIDLPLTVRFGRTELPLKALTRLGPGSIIDLGRSPDEPVDLVVSNQVVARGEVVIVSGNYGIRVLDVVSQRERMRTMEV